MPVISHTKYKLRPIVLTILVFIFFLPLVAAAGDENKVKVGAFTFNPIIFADAEGATRGVSVDLLNKIAAENKWKATYIQGSWSEGLDRIKRGEIDLITAVMYSEERDQFLDYTEEPFFTVWGEVYVLPSSKIGNILELEGLSVAIMKEDMNASNFRKLATGFGVNCNYVEVASHDDVFAMVQQQKVDAGVAPNSYGILNASRFNLVHSNIIFSPQDLYFAVSDGTNKKLLSEISATIKRWKADEASYYYEILDHWFRDKSRQKIIVPNWVIFLVVGTSCVVVALAIWNKSLKIRVKKRTQALRESDEKFKLLAETSPLAMFMTSGIEQVIEYLNPAAVKLFGYTHDEIPTIDEWWPLAYPDDENRERVAKEWQKRVGYAITTGSEVEPVESVVTCKDGSTKNILWYFSTVGKQNWVLGLDLSDQKKAENEREALIADLQDKTAEQERFIYTVSHDLKSPLVTISGFADLTEQDLNSGDQVSAKNDLAIIKQSALRMRRLLDELLEISRIGIKNNPKEIVNLGTLITDSTGNLSGVINDFKTTVEVGSELPDVMVDKQRFLQVFENLIANAARCSSSTKGGSVVEVGVIRGDGELTCYVKDNGIGIESQYLDKVFGLFEKLDLNSDSTGVGLAIVKRIIETHGGRIWAESEGLGHGSTFFFTLPEEKQ